MTVRRSELELFRGLEAGDPKDLAEFSSRLRRCVQWVLHNRQQGGHLIAGDVDDIVGEALLRLEELRVRGFEGGAPEFKTYLYKVVASACGAAARRQRLVRSLDAPVTLPDGEERPLGEMLREIVDQHLSVDTALETADEAGRARRALETLDQRCRELLRRFYLEETPIRQVAEERGKRPNAIEVALTRCRHRLYAAFLSDYLTDPEPEFKPRVARAAETLSGVLGRVFRAWWSDNRSPTDIAKEIGMTPPETRQLLAKAKVEVWRLVAEGEAR